MHSIDFRQISRRVQLAALLLGAALLSTAPAAAAQDSAAASSASEEDIVVTGVRQQLELIKDFVGDLTLVTANDPLARYEPGAYCPAVLGLSEPRNAEIAARMRAVAAAAGVEPAKAGCKTSALVIFVGNKESFLEAFRRQHPIYFTGLRGEANGPPKEKGPAVAWQLVQHLDPQGQPVQRDADGIAIVTSSMRGSRVLSMLKPVVAMSVVVVERGALVGLTATQIADYVLMRTLTDSAPKGIQVPDHLSILRTLDAPIGTALPVSLTHWDLAYLQGRYTGHPSRYGQSQRAAIRRSMERAVKQQGQRREEEGGE